jgi:Family of unknown function (DUF5681)
MNNMQNESPVGPLPWEDIGMDATSSPPGSAEDTAQKQRGRPFEPGNSGNPRGRPKGSRNKTTMALEALLDGEAAAITRKAIEKALEGDMAALRLCVERVLPARRDRPVAFELPKIETAADASKASSAVLGACAEGTLSTREAAEIMALIASHCKTLELTEIEARLTALEKGLQP